MKKIVIAGAGAYFFAPAIFEDLFVRFRMEAEYWMVDADLDMAELSARGAQALARRRDSITRPSCKRRRFPPTR